MDQEPSLLCCFSRPSGFDNVAELPRVGSRDPPDHRSAHWGVTQQVVQGQGRRAAARFGHRHRPARPDLHVRHLRHRPGQRPLPLPVRRVQRDAGSVHLRVLLRAEEGFALLVEQHADEFFVQIQVVRLRIGLSW